MSETLEEGAKTLTASELFAEEQTEKTEPTEKEGETTETSEAQKEAAKSEKENESEKAEESENNDDSEETDGDDESSKDDGEEKRPKKTSGFKKRINKLNQKLSQKDQEIEYLKKLAFKDKHQDPENEESAGKRDLSGRPREEDFENHSDYEDALIDWKVGQKLESQNKKQTQTQVQNEYEKNKVELGQEITRLKEEHDDFDDLLEEVGDLRIPPWIEQALFKDKKEGAKLLYELLKEPDECRRICALPALESREALGEFKFKIKSSSKKAAPKKTTKAPPPPSPVGSKSEGKKSADDPNISTLEFFKLREEEEKQMRNNFF